VPSGLELIANWSEDIMPFRRTTGIVSNLNTSDPSKEADVIITAATLGFAATYIKNDRPVQFDVDPLDVADQDWTAAFKSAVTKIDRAIANYLKQHDLAPKNKVHAGTSPGYAKGSVIVGVYELAGQSAPPSISAPVLSAKGKALYDKIKNEDPTIIQYTDSWTTTTARGRQTQSALGRQPASWLRPPSNSPIFTRGGCRR
jgi:hypothetical protein